MPVARPRDKLMPNQISILVDGFPEAAPRDMTISQLIDKHHAQHKDLVVEINGRFLHLTDYGSTLLHDGDRVELIHVAFGG